MEIEVDFQSGIPLYEQIAHQVLELIEDGVLKPGDQLPTTRELAVKLGVNFNTVARAYRMLDQGEIISTQHGRGTFILEQRDNKDAGNTAIMRARLNNDSLIDKEIIYKAVPASTKNHHFGCRIRWKV